MNIIKPDLKWNGTLRKLNRVEKLIQHHMAHPVWDITDVHRYHRDHNGWAGIGYNYWISFKGDIYEARGLYQGAHAGSNWNGRSIGIGYQGHFEEQTMTDEQLKAGAWLNAKFIREYGLGVGDIIGHKGVSATACPGRNFRMSELKKRTEKLLSENGNNILYRVQIGAFRSYENAQKYAEEAGADGYDTYIGMRNGMYIVQIGAFSSKENAEILAGKAEADGYDTYITTDALEPAEKPAEEPETDNGKDSGEEKEEKEEDEEEVVDDDDEDEEEEEEVEGVTPVAGDPLATVNQAKTWARNRGARELFIEKAETFWHYGEITGIRPEVAYALSARETAFKHHGGVIDSNFHNWGGIKTAEGGSDDDPDAHERFASDDDGIRAVFNHMCAYVGYEPAGEPHGRYYVVKSTDWAGRIKTVEEMGYRWATDKNYGQTLVKNYLEDLLATEAENGDEKEEEAGKEEEKEHTAPGSSIWYNIVSFLKDLVRRFFDGLRS